MFRLGELVEYRQRLREDRERRRQQEGTRRRRMRLGYSLCMALMLRPTPLLM
ncbi:hypothetical protein IQ274_25095 [Nostoc sp. LEGE 12447]|uniref:hypothetical protein n=1 Tax=Nostoc sp. LEGE 12447 TaxID=1828640 RepID=UPI001883780A|nr:hypothetical protein [Nostoc sp. LEGE 12447]MBE9001402.1 hypothetical protein [Nostoc sp. LEGE 12447]